MLGTGSGGRPQLDIVIAGSRIYTPNRHGIGDLGQCFWDTMKSYGISDSDLQQAANTTSLTIGKDVNEDEIFSFLTTLSTFTGQAYKLNIDRIDLMNLKYLETLSHGDGQVEINIGFFFDLNTGLGHYVPPI